ncbi:hypothetical protein [Ruminiclostridium cellobioparum]|uniref:hypothetical protein n=1 Tax=Ruminiclostridium cellobioparum TaxID=29355 RepID=UPI0028AC0AB5|nr:hypothetical protein [Ruminiclostridium cellobioparum]
MNQKYTIKLRANENNNIEEKEELQSIKRTNSKKCGRPIKNENTCKKKCVKVYCTEDDLLAFQQYCDSQNTSGSEVLYKFLRRLIRKKSQK